ncbi:DNA polymerase IV, partial [Chloroflexota bacterium]
TAIQQKVKNELGLCVSVGIASAKTVAKIASDLSKPDGLIEVPAGEECPFLSPLPIARLPGIGKKSERILKGLGVNTIGQLAALPPDILKSRFGAAGEILRNYAKGIDGRKIEPPGAAKSMSRETTFGKDTGDHSLLMATLRYLGERVGSELRQQGKQARCVILKLRYADFTTITRQQTLSQASDTDQDIFDTGCESLKKELSETKQAVRLIGIGVSNLIEAGHQLDMLDTSAQRLKRLNTTIDRIRNKYGFTTIQTGRTLLLKDLFPPGEGGYTLHTPSLSR